MVVREPLARADILIVDDNLNNLRFLSDFLFKKGYQVRKAIDGESALLAVQALLPNLILLDISMPGLNGFDVCQQLKDDPRTSAIPVLFLSARNDVDDKVRAFQVGGVDYIEKPYHLEEVLVRIQTQLKLQTLQRKLQSQNEELQQLVIHLKDAKASLETSRAEANALFRAMNELIIVFDSEGRHLKIANTNTHLLYEPDKERLGKTLHDALPKPQADLILNAIRQALATQQTVDVEYSLMMEQGKMESWTSLSPISADRVLCVVRDITDRKRREEALQLIVEGTAAKTGDEFFRACVRSLAEVLGIRYAFVTECTDDHRTRVRTLAFWLHTSFAENIEYDLEGTPCDEVINQGTYSCYGDNIIDRFPIDCDLVDLNARSYAGIPLINSMGEVIGHIAVLDTEPMINDATRELVLKIFSARAGAELERQKTDMALQESQERSERLLLNVLPATIAERLKHDTSAIAEQFDEVTILFADLVGFTPLSTRMKPTELVNLLNDVFSYFDQLTEKYQLEKIKTIGDAYMVVGGLPIPTANHAEAVAEMALEMQRAIATFQTPSGEPLQLRIGMNTGSVVAGVIGVKKFIYDLWGDAVNVASRMETLAAPGQIQVTEALYHRLRSHYILKPRASMQVKGKGSMTTYWLLGKVVS